MDKGRVLDSWKAIAAYVGRNIRTCQTWERALGLPVHRLEGASRSRVFAYTGEIDAWREEKGVKSSAGRARRASVGIGFAAALLALIFGLDLGGVRERLLGRPDSVRIETIAVLPVENYSGDPDQDVLAEGITDALISRLGAIRAFKNVISRTSIQQYKDTTKSMPQIAGELGVDGIVEASLTLSGKRVAVRARLVEGRRNRQIGRSIEYSREMTDILSLYSDVVQALASEIRIQITPLERERLGAVGPVDPGAYDLAIRGNVLIEHAGRDSDIRQAVGLFQKAVDLDPAYAPGWAGLGESLWYQAVYGFEFVPPAEVRDRAVAAAERALELDGSLPEAHMARAIIAVDGEWDIARAEQHYRRAIELRPGYANAHVFYGLMLSGQPLFRFEEGRRHLDRARALDPLSPWNDINLMAWWTLQGKPEKAMEVGAHSWQMNKAPWSVRRQIGLACLLMGQPNQAISEIESALELIRPDRPPSFLGPLGLACGLAGRENDALGILTELELASRVSYVSPYYRSIVSSGAGRMDEAFELLEEALEQRNPRLFACTRYDPLCVAFRHDPRWRTFLEKLRRLIKLPPGSEDPYL